MMGTVAIWLSQSKGILIDLYGIMFLTRDRALFLYYDFWDPTFFYLYHLFFKNCIYKWLKSVTLAICADGYTYVWDNLGLVGNHYFDILLIEVWSYVLTANMCATFPQCRAKEGRHSGRLIGVSCLALPQVWLWQFLKSTYDYFVKVCCRTIYFKNLHNVVEIGEWVFE